MVAAGADRAAGQWDDSDVCCATAVDRDGSILLLWYAGNSKKDQTWRIGLATSSDGLMFQKHAGNPVLREGGREEFDGRGAADPEVVWDTQRKLFRMWYSAEAFLGIGSIGYAVSTDGVRWHKFPSNPVLSRADLGVESLSSPAVLLEEGQLRMWPARQGARSARAPNILPR